MQPQKQDSAQTEESTKTDQWQFGDGTFFHAVEIEGGRYSVTVSPEASPEEQELILEGLGSANLARREAATYQLGINGSEHVVPALSAIALWESNDAVRKGAIWALGQIGGESAAAILVELCKDCKNLALSQTLFEAVAKVGTMALDVVPELIKGLKDRDLQVQKSAVLALRSMGSGATRATPGLASVIHQARNPDSDATGLREEAIDTLITISPKESSSLFETILFNRDSNYDLNVAAVHGLTKIASESDLELAQPVLQLVVARHTNSLIRQEAIGALKKIGDARSLSALLNVLERDTVRDVTDHAAAVSAIIQRIEMPEERVAAANIVITKVIDAIEVESSNVSGTDKRALFFLENIAQDIPNAALPVFVLKLADLHEGVRLVATHGVELLAPHINGKLINQIAQLINHPNQQVKYAAISALGALKHYAQRSGDAVSALGAIFSDRNSTLPDIFTLKALALTSLAKIGGFEALAVVQVAKKDPDRIVAEAADRCEKIIFKNLGE